MKIIGKGKFTRCYQHPDNKNKVVLISNCWAKECSAMGWMPSSQMYPKIEKVDYPEGLDNDASKYQMKKFKQVRSLRSSLNAHHYTMYKQLREFSYNLRAIRSKYESHDILHDAINDSPLMPKLKRLLAESLDALANYGDGMMFEVSPRNVAVDNGKLILLDCWFFVEREKLVL